jgi:hypothetical protein
MQSSVSFRDTLQECFAFVTSIPGENLKDHVDACFSVDKFRLHTMV